jgi:outer membrane protein OmpA-like peptidoglycan-associated protein
MKQLSLMILSLVIFSTGISFSQTEDDRINFYDGVFFIAEEDYQESLAAFNKLYKGENQNNSNLNYLIGLCYLKIPGEKTKSIPYLEKAVLNVTEKYSESNFKEKSAPKEAYMLLADAYRINEEFDKAVSNYKIYIELSDEQEEYEIALANQQIEACKRAKTVIKEPYFLKKESIGNLYNSSFDNYNPVVSADGTAVAFMSAQRFYDAVIFVEVNNGRWSNPINITPQIQSDGDQYVTSLSADGNTMYLIRSNIEDADIMVSTYESRRWTKSENLGKPINTKYFESHASIAPDGKSLYFVSNRKESTGGMDIFVSELGENGDWSEPKNLGSSINTILNEDSPVVGKDGKTLYFSSQGHSSIGGYDIFKSTINDDGTWSEAIALPYPLNTTDDDLFFTPLEDGFEGYMARIEPDGLGGQDIYKVMLSEEPFEEVVAEVVEEVVEEISPVSPDTVMEEEITDAEEPVEELTETVVEEPEEIVPTAKYYIKPIFFAFDSYVIDEISKTKLKEIKSLMDTYKELNLKVLGHTDSKGPDAYNQYLSEQRCKAVFKYLINEGVDENRLELVGYGESKPAAMNETPDGKDSVKGRQLNRRVEFKISVKHEDMIIVEPVPVPENLKIK